MQTNQPIQLLGLLALVVSLAPWWSG